MAFKPPRNLRHEMKDANGKVKSVGKNEIFNQILADADKAQDFYTVSGRMAGDGEFSNDFTTAYENAAQQHGYTVRGVGHYAHMPYVYLVDSEGNNTMYDADVAKDALKAMDRDRLTSYYKPLTDEDIANSKSILDDMIYVGSDHDILTFEYNNNPLYGRFGELRAGEGSRIMDDDQKQAYIDAINNLDTLELPGDINGYDDQPLTITSIAKSLDIVNTDNGQVGVWVVTDDLDASKATLINAIKNDNALLNKDIDSCIKIQNRVMNGQLEPIADTKQEDQVTQTNTTPEQEVDLDISLEQVYNDADKINDYYTAQKVMAEDVDEDYFGAAYTAEAIERGYEPRVFDDIRGYEDNFIYLVDADGNAKTYDADVAKATFKHLAASGDFDADAYEPLDKRAIAQSQNMAGQFHLVGRNHDVPLLDMVENDLYEGPTSDDYKSRYLTDEDKELYINAVKNAPDVDNEAMDDSPLSLSSIVQNFDPVYDDAVGNGNGDYFDTIAREHGLEEDEATFVYKATPEQDKALREDLIDRIKNDEFVRTGKIDYFYPEVESKARKLGNQEAIKEAPVADASDIASKVDLREALTTFLDENKDTPSDELDGELKDFLSGLDDLNKNQDNGLQQ